MNRNNLIDSIGEIDDNMVEKVAALRITKKKKSLWLKWGAVAACLCLIILSIPILLRHTGTPKTDHPDEALLPHIVLNNRKFFVSPHLYSSEVLPDGFEKAGSVSTSDGFENCPYYLNPSVPEWVYVYQETETNGEVDENGTIIETKSHPAFIRYLDERLLSRELICYKGLFYISMWSVDPLTDITKDYYQQMMDRYGNRIEGVLPDGFVFAGKSEFTGEDTVPKGILASNKKEEDIYYNPEDSEVLLMKTQWFTANESNGETVHDGFDVYIQYDCPFNLTEE